MSKLVLNDISDLSASSAVSKINENFTAIEVAMEKTLSRDNTAPNQMTGQLDMNSNNIVNLAPPTAGGHPITVDQLAGLSTIGSGDGIFFPTLASVIAASGIETAPSEIYVGKSRFLPATSEPSHPGKVSITLTDTTVQWYELWGIIYPETFGAVMDGVTNDDTAMTDAGLIAKATGASIFVAGTVKLASYRNDFAEASRIGGGDILLPNGSLVPWCVTRNDGPVRMNDTGTAATTTFTDGAYNAFPRMTRMVNGNLVSTWWRGTAHSPNQPGGNQDGDIMIGVSTDNNFSMETPFPLFGNLTGTDTDYTYYYASGVTSDGLGVMIFRFFDPVVATTTTLNISFTKDGFVWSPPATLSIPDFGIHTELINYIPFGKITHTPSGKLLVPFYTSAGVGCGVIDYNTDKYTMDISSTIFTGSTRSEVSVEPLNETNWIALVRVDGSTSANAMYETTTGGTSWVDKGSTNLPISGGYVPQDLFLFNHAGELNIGAFIGLRETASAPPADAPGFGLFAANRKDSEKFGTFQFQKIKTWSIASDAAIRDAYGSVYVDPITLSVAGVGHQETTDTTSDIVTFGTNLADVGHLFPVTQENDFSSTIAVEGSTTAGTQTFGTNIAITRRVGPQAEVYIRFTLTAATFTGSMVIKNLPFNALRDCEFPITTSTFLTAGHEGTLVGRMSAGSNEITVFERSGLSGLTLAEINQGGTSDFRIDACYAVGDD